MKLSQAQWAYEHMKNNKHIDFIKFGTENDLTIKIERENKCQCMECKLKRFKRKTDNWSILKDWVKDKGRNGILGEYIDFSLVLDKMEKLEKGELNGKENKDT